MLGNEAQDCRRGCATRGQQQNPCVVSCLILFRKTVSAPTANSNRGKGSKGFQGLLRLLDFGPNRAQRQIQAIPESGLATSAPEARRARQLCAAGRAVPPCG